MRIVCIALVVLMMGCATQPTTSVYDAMGGNKTVEKVVDNFIDEIAYDAVIYPFFKETNIDRFREKMIEQICMETGGPCEYSGDSMQQVHSGMNISEADFNRMVDLLINAMTRAGLSHPQQNKILAIFAPMRKDMIYR